MVVGLTTSHLVESSKFVLNSLPFLELSRSHLLLERRLHNSILGGVVSKHLLAHLDELGRWLRHGAKRAIHVDEGLGAAVVLPVVDAAVRAVVTAVEHALVLID